MGVWVFLCACTYACLLPATCRSTLQPDFAAGLLVNARACRSASWQLCVLMLVGPVRAPAACCLLPAGALCGADEGLPQHLPECLHLPRPYVLPGGLHKQTGGSRLSRERCARHGPRHVRVRCARCGPRHVRVLRWTWSRARACVRCARCGPRHVRVRCAGRGARHVEPLFRALL